MLCLHPPPPLPPFSKTPQTKAYFIERKKYHLRKISTQNLPLGESDFDGKNEESSLEESQKSTKAKTPWEDQRLAQVFKNISKKPGTNQNQSHLQNQAGGEANLIQKKNLAPIPQSLTANYKETDSRVKFWLLDCWTIHHRKGYPEVCSSLV